MKRNKKPAGLRKTLQTAIRLVKDRETVEHLLREALDKAERHRSVLANVWENLQALLRLTRAWLRNEYSGLPRQTIVFVVAAIVYFVNPFDIIPDFIPGSGFLDDATVIGFVLKSVKQDITTFLHWESARNGIVRTAV